MDFSVDHQPARQRFTAVVDGQESVLEYRLSGDTMTILSTAVPPGLRGRGIAGGLARFALHTARARGWSVVPVCSYAARYFRKHPEYGDLLA